VLCDVTEDMGFTKALESATALSLAVVTENGVKFALVERMKEGLPRNQNNSARVFTRPLRLGIC